MNASAALLYPRLLKIIKFFSEVFRKMGWGNVQGSAFPKAIAQEQAPSFTGVEFRFIDESRAENPAVAKLCHRFFF